MGNLINFNSATPRCVDPATLKDKVEPKKAEKAAQLLDGMAEQFGAQKVGEHSFTYAPSEAHREALFIDTFHTLEKLFSEKGGELEILPFTVCHTKSDVTVGIDLSKYINQGMFALNTFINEVSLALNRKRRACEMNSPEIKLKQSYPDTIAITSVNNKCRQLIKSKL